MEIKKFLESKIFKVSLCVIGSIVLAILIFRAGMSFGYRKANFSYKGGENFYRIFGRHSQKQKSYMMDFFGSKDRNFPNMHGSTGKVIKIDLPALLVEDQDGIEKTIVINNESVIKRFRDTIKDTDIKLDDFIVVIGNPNDKGEIEAKLIRTMPTLPSFSSSNSMVATSGSNAIVK